ncbi:unnamed protein product [Rangifer tarandus platyrhynchus]|uniref:Uncharacterized protein n=1 Tax=Rangifer tarandus platyrhynchus TaxID=3082113 RepID=A0ABN8XHZ3_RANTA|nr:unnamed protein product [Rangifer tarandus platyrhynchus]
MTLEETYVLVLAPWAAGWFSGYRCLSAPITLQNVWRVQKNNVSHKFAKVELAIHDDIVLACDVQSVLACKSFSCFIPADMQKLQTEGGQRSSTYAAFNRSGKLHYLHCSDSYRKSALRDTSHRTDHSVCAIE